MELVYFDDNNEINHNLDVYNEDEIESEYEDLLNEIYPNQEAFGSSISARDYRDHLDPIAFRCGCNDWSSEEFIEHPFIGFLRKSDNDELQNDLYDLKNEIEEEIESLKDFLDLLIDDEDYDNNVESTELELDELREKINKIKDYET